MNWSVVVDSNTLEKVFGATYFEAHCTAIPRLNCAFLDADLKLGSVVRNTPYYNIEDREVSQELLHTPPGG